MIGPALDAWLFGNVSGLARLFLSGFSFRKHLVCDVSGQWEQDQAWTTRYVGHKCAERQGLMPRSHHVKWQRGKKSYGWGRGLAQGHSEEVSISALSSAQASAQLLLSKGKSLPS